MKRVIGLSFAAIVATANVYGSSVEDKLSALEQEIAMLKKQLKKQKKKLNEVKAHDAGDNIKWSADLRTSFDKINFDMANGGTRSKDSLWGLRLWLNMEFAPDSNNVFKAQISANKAFGADFGGYDPANSMYNRTFSMGGMFDWVNNEALTDNSLKVRQAYWLYLGDKLLGTDVPWTFSLGRRPSTNGFLANLRDDDPAQSPLGHIINVEFDGLSSKFDLSNVTGVPGMSFKVCMGQGSTNATPLFDMSGTSYNESANSLKDIKLAGFIFEPYNDGQYIVKTTWYKAFDLPGMEVARNNDYPVAKGADGRVVDPDPDPVTGAPRNPDFATANYTYEPTGFVQNGNMYGAAISVMVDGLSEDGILSETKIFGSYAWSKTDPNAGKSMLGSSSSETGTSFWVGAQVPVIEGGKFGLEYNKGSKYWRPFTYAEDTMIGSKLAARGSAWESYFTYQLTDALSFQVRYTSISYDYTGSNGFFGNYSGTPTKISDMKAGAAGWDQMSAAVPGGLNPTSPADISAAAGALLASGKANDQKQAQEMAFNMASAKVFLPNVVEKAQDLRFYIRYRF